MRNIPYTRVHPQKCKHPRGKKGKRKDIKDIYRLSPLFLEIFPKNLSSEELKLYIDEIQEITGALNDLPLLLRDDFLKLIFKANLDSEKTIVELRNAKKRIKKEIDTFLEVYPMLHSEIKRGIEDSRSIGNIRNIPEVTGIIIALLRTCQNLPSDVREIVPNFEWVKDGFEIEEIEEFTAQILLNFDNDTFREWFVKNYFLYDVSTLKMAENDFSELEEKDTVPPKIECAVEIDDEIFFEDESPETTISIFVEDNINRIMKVSVSIGEYTEEMRGEDSLHFSKTLTTILEVGAYQVEIEVTDAGGNTASKTQKYEYYPDVYTLELTELYDPEKISAVWEKAKKYRPI